VGWIICAVIIGLVATCTSIRRIDVITVMALVTTGRGMCPGERIISIMYGKSGRCPAWIGRVTALAIGRNPDGAVRRIGGVVIVSQMATHTCIWYIGVIAVMTLVTVCSGMCPGERVIIIMDNECCRRPARIGRVTALAIGGYTDGAVGRIGRAVIIDLVATYTGIWYLGVITIMALITVCGGMCPGKGIIITMDGKCCRRPAWIGRVTALAIGGYPDGAVGWIICAVIIGLVATCTSIRRIGVITVMALVTVYDGSMCPDERIIIAMDSKCGRRPTWICRVAGSTGGRNAER
jgi:hypothetical protein